MSARCTAPVRSGGRWGRVDLSARCREVAEFLRRESCEHLLLKNVAGLAEGGCYGAEAPVAGRNSRVFIDLAARYSREGPLLVSRAVLWRPGVQEGRQD